jgi:Family of unknown function (DUF6232)
MTTPAVAPEVTFYSDEGGVRVTNSRLIIGPVTYAMLNITSVSRAFTKPNRLLPVLLIVIGVLVLFASFSGHFEVGPFMIGIVLAGLGALVWKFQKTKYHLRIASASGEANAITSVNADQIDKIVQAVNEAMIKRG